MLSDLQDAFALYDKEGADCISIQHLKNILHNFGFNRLNLKDYNEELRKIDGEFSKRTGCDFNFCKYAVANRLNSKHGGGFDIEAKDCFKLFDKRERGVINA